MLHIISCQRNQHHRCGALKASPLLDGEDHKVLVDPSNEEELKDVADYDWTQEWYPLYLTHEVPEDAPLGLKVFNKQLVLFREGKGDLRCYEDRCPHRFAKLSEGQLIDGRLECLYQGWQFEGEGKCVKIPQLPTDPKIPLSACVKTYEVKDSQGVVWVWMSPKTTPNVDKLPWFENIARPGFQDVSTIHVFEQDMGFLSSQNETLVKEKAPTKELYLNLRSSDTWIVEYRKWMDKVGHGVPYHFGYNTVSLPKEHAVIEHAPAGLIAEFSAASPAKGGIGSMHAPNLFNRYFRHVVHCKVCRTAVKAFQAWKSVFSGVAVALVALAILVSGTQWKALMLVPACMCLVGVYACSIAIAMTTSNFIRTHRRL
ncbi:Protein TIC 55, chloroplastic, partial [Mucuna pruriens]